MPKSCQPILILNRPPDCSKPKRKRGPTGPTGPTGPCCTGPTGPTGPAGTLECFDCLINDVCPLTGPIHVLIPKPESENASVVIQTLGNGFIARDVPTPDDPEGGNCRGIFATDWQASRNNATQVASGEFSVIGGGRRNTASGDVATVAGGSLNTASGFISFVAGGQGNRATNAFSVVVGGQNNTASGFNSFVGGGASNTASGFISFVGAGQVNNASGFVSFVGNGNNNTASGSNSFVGSGASNTASGVSSFVGAGQVNNASGFVSFVGSGNNNTASGVNSFVGGGAGNAATNTITTIAGGDTNTVTANGGTIGGGVNNIVDGPRSVIPGGENLTIPVTTTFGFATGRFNAFGPLNGSERVFMVGRGTSNVNRLNLFSITANGNAFLQGTLTQNTVADYAEWFESELDQKIPLGISVSLIPGTGKIRTSIEGDVPIGVISNNPAILANAAEEYWVDKYVRDLGVIVQEEIQREVEVPKLETVEETVSEIIAETLDSGEIIYRQVKRTKQVQREVKIERRILNAQGETVGTHTEPVMEKQIVTEIQPKINPKYDPTLVYIPRSQRPEWNIVGLVGIVKIQKKQPTAPNWVFMKPYNEEYDLWLIK